MTYQDELDAEAAEPRTFEEFMRQAHERGLPIEVPDDVRRLEAEAEEKKRRKKEKKKRKNEKKEKKPRRR
jgi:membrane peptidoglycan carboxypeptidase